MSTIGTDCDVLISNADIDAPLIMAQGSRIEHNTLPSQSSDPDLLLLNETLKITVRGSDNLLQPDGQPCALTRAQTGTLIQSLLNVTAESSATFSIYTYGIPGLAIADDASLVAVQKQITPAYDDYTLIFTHKLTFGNALALGSSILTLYGQVLTLGENL